MALAVGVCAVPAAGYALDSLATPTGEVVVGGSATFSRPQAGQLDVTQTSDRLIIDWDRFDIGSQASTQFFQPGSSAIAVNRVTSGIDPTQILGSLRSNGQIVVLDPNGVIFGRDSVVDVGGIVASTGSIDDAAFLSGAASLSLDSRGGAGSVINEGTIRVQEAGLAALVAPHVVNSGTITARMGRVVLAGTVHATLDLYGDGLIQLDAGAAPASVSVTNTGTLAAEAGTVRVAAHTAKGVVDGLINMDGVASASSVEMRGGKIILHGGDGGDVTVRGRMDAKGTRGGEISVTGRDVVLTETARVDASGYEGGGTVLIGGEYLGGGSLMHARTTTLAAGGRIDASALNSGDGGTVILWSDDQTRVAGSVLARGGTSSGNGGFIETSSHTNLSVSRSAVVDASAPAGLAGSWLLDPRDVTLQSGGAASVTGNSVYDAAADNQTVDTASIEAALNAGMDVTITTGSTGTQNGDIWVSSAISKTGGADASLTLRAARGIFVYSSIASTSGALNVILNADSDANQVGKVKVSSATITTNGGDLVLGGGADPYTTAAWDSSDMNIGGVFLQNFNFSTGAGDVVINGHGGGTGNAGVYMDTGSITTSGGDVRITGVGRDGTSINYGIYSSLVSMSSTGTGASAGDIVLTGTGGNGSSSNNRGIYILSSTLTTVDGDILITGTGGIGTLTNYGIWVGGSSISSSGTGVNAGHVTLVGTGGASLAFGTGIGLGNTSITVVDGDLSLTGTGNGTAISNFGVLVSTGASLSSTGTDANAGDITITGTSGTGSSTGNHGISIAAAGSITSADGDIVLTGVGRGTSSESHGIYGASAATPRIQSSGGDLIMTGTGALSWADINILSDQSFASLGSGDVVMNADRLGLAGSFSVPNGSVTIKPRTAGTLIELGGVSGTVNLNLTDAELAYLSAGGGLIIGDAATGTGAITVDSVTLPSALSLYGGAITINNGLTSTGGAILLKSSNNEDITLNSAVTAAGSGNAIVIAADGDFINNAGASALVPGSGRYLVYSDAPSTTTKGGLAGSNLYSRSYASTPPASVGGSGNTFLFGYTPLLTITPTAPAQQIYGDAAPSSYAYAVSGYLNAGDESADVITNPNLVWGTTYAPGVTTAGSGYTISRSSGGLSSAIGYGFTYGTASGTVSPRALTVRANNQNAVAGAPLPTFTGTSSLIASDAGLVSFTFSPQNYTGMIGSYLIGTATSDPSNRLANYVRTDVPGTFTVSAPEVLANLARESAVPPVSTLESSESAPGAPVQNDDQKTAPSSLTGGGCLLTSTETSSCLF